MKYPDNYRYSKDHEWVENQKSECKVGITHFAQSELGEVVYVELPPIGKVLKAGDPACVVESTKAASDVYSPVAGTVIAVNEALREQTTLLNQDPHQGGWIFQLSGVAADDLEKLMSADEYESKYRR